MRAAVIAVVISIVAPISWAWADNRFADVPANNNHHANISAIADAGITLGCGGGNYCPSGSVRRDQMASFLARLGGLGGNARVANGRGDVSAYCAAAAALPGRFPRGQCANTVRVVQANADLIQSYTDAPVAVAMGPGGRPVVAFLVKDPQDPSGAFVRIAQCGDDTCSSVASADVGVSPRNGGVAIAIGSDGNVIAFYASSQSGTMQIARCSIACATVQRENLPTAGSHPSIVIGSDGAPVVAYKADGLFVARCASACATTQLDGSERINAGEYNAIAIGGDGVPIVSYYERVGGDLRVVRCTDAVCSSGTEPVTLVADGDVGWYSSIVVGVDGVPVIAHLDIGNSDAVVTRCTDVVCSEAASTVVVDPFGSRGVSVALREDGIPVIANRSVIELKVSRCLTPVCLAVSPPTIVDGAATNSVDGTLVSLAFGSDGVPSIAYYRHNSSQIKFARVPTY